MLFAQQTLLCTVLIAISLSTAKEVEAQCGDSQICIRDPPSCSPDSECRFIAIFSPTGDSNLMRLNLQARSDVPRPYVAIRFSDTRLPVRSTVIYCSPKERILRFGFEQDGRVDFATQSASDMMASISNSWARDGLVRCEFDRVITAPRGMLAAQSLSSPLHVQIITGSISSDGFPMSPVAAYTTNEAVDLARVIRDVSYDSQSTTADMPETTEPFTQDESTTLSPAGLSEKDLESLPEVNEKDLIVDEDDNKGMKADEESTTEAPPMTTEEYSETSEMMPTSTEAAGVPTSTGAETTDDMDEVVTGSIVNTTNAPSESTGESAGVVNATSELVYDGNNTVIATITGVHNVTNATADSSLSSFELFPEGKYSGRSNQHWRNADNSTRTAGSGHLTVCSFAATVLLGWTLF